MAKVRKAIDVWKEIEDADLTWKERQTFRRSYGGVKKAIESLNLVMITSKSEFDNLDIPITRDGYRHYDRRKIIVSRDGVISKPLRIDSVLTGNNGLLTDLEREAINVSRSQKRSSVLSKGTATNNNKEHSTIEELHRLIGLEKHLHHSYLDEHRLGDVAYSTNGNSWVGDQVKSVRVSSYNDCIFNHSSGLIKVKHILHYLDNDLSVTFIGKDRDDNIAVVWLFTVDAVPMLNTFRPDQYFAPKLYLKRKSLNKFTLAYNHPDIRYDIKIKSSDTKRLLMKKIAFATSGTRHTNEFFNEDLSQITSPSTKIEQQSFIITRDACASINIIVSRCVDDQYSKIDFRIGNCRIQDKVANAVFNMRRQGGYPFNPDKIDVFQVSDIAKHIVYAIPMRIKKNNEVISFFSKEMLMKNTIWFRTWKDQHEQYRCDLKTENGVTKYVELCRNAADILPLSDDKFYANLITDNHEKFGVRRSFRNKVIRSC